MSTTELVAKTPLYKRMGITGWIFVALLLGILVGLTANILLTGDSFIQTTIIKGIFGTVGKGFIRLMQMLVVPLVLCSIVCGAVNMGSGSMIGRVGGLTFVMYILTTVLAVTLALFMGFLIGPGLGIDFSQVAKVEVKQVASVNLSDTFLDMIPKNIFESLTNGSMLQVIFFALVVGVLLGKLNKKAKAVTTFFQQANELMMSMVTFVLYLAPIGVFCLITSTFSTLGFAAILPLIKYLGGMLITLVVQVLGPYLLLLVLVARVNPLRFFQKFLPVMGFAFATSTSNATIPMNIETLERKVGVDPKIASFTIPLGATINMDGTVIMQGMAVVFAAQAFGVDLGLTGYITVVLMATLASVGTAGVPGVGLVTLTMVFQSVGLPIEAISMLMGVDRLGDMARTAVNVTGDAVVTTCVARINKSMDMDVFKSKNGREPVTADTSAIRISSEAQ